MSRSSNLPVPVGKPSETRRERIRPTESASAGAFEAQLLGQDGARRGLRGGEPVLQAARAAYLDTEWSGAGDRRIGRGEIMRSKV